MPSEVINGTDGDDYIEALDGDDTIIGSAGNDAVDGGTGIDTFVLDLSGTSTNASVTQYAAVSELGRTDLYSVEKFDITGGWGEDVIEGGDLDDTLSGGEGGDYLDGGLGADILDGDAGNDVLVANGADTLNGGADDDTAVINFAGTNTGQTLNFANAATSMTLAGGIVLNSIEAVNFTGGDGDDHLTGTMNADTIDGGYGNDRIVMTGGNDVLNGGYGDVDTLIYDGSASEGGISTGWYGPGSFATDNGVSYYSDFEQLNVIGSAQADFVDGGSGYDTLIGGGGDDILNAGTGGGLIDGGAGFDVGGVDMSEHGGDMTVEFSQAAGTLNLADGTVFRSIEAVNVKAGYGNDTLTGTAFDDTIGGGYGDDRVVASGGYDYLYGGDGSDTLRFDGSTESVQVWAAVSYVYSSLGYTTAYEFERLDAIGGSGDDYFEGGIENDTIVANAGNDYVVSGTGDDAVDAGAGDDVVYAGGGADSIVAGDGDDYIDGGEDEDTLTYTAPISDYSVSLDPYGSGALIINGPTGTDTVLNVETFVFDGVTYTREDLEHIAVPCFLPGTLILTPEGEKPVESLKIGDLVATVDCTALPIKWIGRRCFKPPFSSLSPAIAPVLIRAGALGRGLPARDLMVSPCHAMLIDGVFVAARDLVDGIGIQQWFGLPEVSYLHIEFEQPEAIYAEGAATESYVDHGNRAMYENAAEYETLYGPAPQDRAEHPRRFPLVSGAEQLARLKARLVSRSPFRRAA